MTDETTPIRELQHNLEDALDLLQEYAGGPAGMPLDPLPSLLEQCEALCADIPREQPLRSLHHLACTGGTLISKCLAAMPNVSLLSEIDPLSHMQIAPGQPYQFRPTDLIYGARLALRPIDDRIAGEMFHASMRILHDELTRMGRHLVLRDHAHSQFCSDSAPDTRPTLHDMLCELGPVRSVVTIRHPLDTFLSLNVNKWRHFTPFTLEEHARRYARFLACHEGLPRYRYEDFVRAPETVLRDICADLEIDYAEGSENLLEVVSLSGDSGRSSARIAPRERRAIPQFLAEQIEDSAAYDALCAQLGYEARPAAEQGAAD